MAPAKDEREPPALFSAPVDGSPQRPKNLLQRLTSGLSTLLPNKASRRSSASNSDRPKTAPFPYHKHKHILRLRRHPPNHELMITPHISIPKLSDADSTRPYDSSTYHSSTSNEGEHSRIRDLSPFFKRASASSASDRPCNHCHSRIPSSNLASPLRCSSRRDSCSSDICSDLPSVDEASLFIEDIPCIVPYELAARRIGNPPRKSSLPTGLRPSYSTSHLSPTAALDSQSHHGNDSHAIPQHGASSTRDSRPVSPRLHHLHGLPHAHSHPYVRESEVDAHIAALEAGSLSPLLQAVDEEGPAIPNSNKPCRDFSRTVYYGTTPASAASSLIIQRVETSKIVVDTEMGMERARMRLKVEETEITREHTPCQAARTNTRTERLSPRVIDDMASNEVAKIEHGSAELQLRGGDAGDVLSTRDSSLRATTPPRNLQAVRLCPYHSIPFPRIGFHEPHAPTLHLRGGASSPTRLPPTLFFLAGGTGRKPISVRAWKQQRGTTRMCGLLGMAVFGRGAGREWSGDERCDAESEGEASDKEKEEGTLGEGRGRSGSIMSASRCSGVGQVGSARDRTSTDSTHTMPAGSIGASEVRSASLAVDGAREAACGGCY